MRYTAILVAIALSAAAGYAQQPGDLFYVPKKHAPQAPALIITSCTGATQADIDSNQAVADSLGWILATCARTKNHQNADLNDQCVMATYQSLIAKYPIDRSRVFIYGFSGQAVQALMEVFLHPELLRGAVAICAHAGAMPLAQWETLTGKGFYLISRQKDWNLADNEKIHQLFQMNNIRDTLVVTKGQHGPKDRSELFKGSKWLNRNLK